MPPPTLSTTGLSSLAAASSRWINLSLPVARKFGFGNQTPVSFETLWGVIEPHLENSEIRSRLGVRQALLLKWILKGGIAENEVRRKALQDHLETLASLTKVTPIRRIFVPNRGEAASRLITAARELSLERGEKIEVIVMYMDGDEKAPYVLDADRAIHIPPEKVREIPDPNDPTKKVKLLPYNDMQTISEILTGLVEESQERGETAASVAVWPGWGFSSEKEELAEAVIKTGACFIGASPAAIKQVGDKIGFKKLADPEQKTWGEASNLEEAKRVARRLGFPIVIKATAGGGGQGIRFVFSEEDLEANFVMAQKEALRAFNNPTVFIEKMAKGRHIEVQVIADSFGNVVAVGDRDCSIQRKNQKIIEEAPAPNLPPNKRKHIHNMATEVVRKSGYVGAATVEGLYNDETGEFFPMELNARLQVEHTITEMVTGIDLVKEQIRIAEGHPLSFRETPTPRGTAFEVRINAEDPDNGFEATGGVLRVFRPPTGGPVRVDTGVRQGSEIKKGFDSMAAKLINWRKTRREAIGGTQRAILDFDIDGVITNKGFGIEILGHPDFGQVRYTNRWLEDVYMKARRAWEVKPHSRESVLIAAALSKMIQVQEYHEKIRSLVSRGRPPSFPPPKESRFHFSLFGHDYEAAVQGENPGRYLVTVEGASFSLEISKRGESSYDVTIDDKKIPNVVGSEKGGDFTLTLEGVTYVVTKPPVGEVTATGNGNVTKIFVKEGEMVEAGQPILIIEAMKQELTVKAAVAGRLEKILVKVGQPVTEGNLLGKINADVGEKKPPEAPRLVFQSNGDGLAIRPGMTKEEAEALGKKALQDLPKYFPLFVRMIRQAVLGHDILTLFYQIVPKDFSRVTEPSFLSAEVMQVLEAAVKKGIGRVHATQAIASVLSAFIDVELLFQREALRGSLNERSLVDQFYDFLKTKKAEGSFRERLLAALRHYGVASLDPSPELDQGLAQILIAHDQFGIRMEVVRRLIRVLKKWDEGDDLHRSNQTLAESLEKFTRLDREHLPLIHAAEGLLFSIYESQITEVSRGEAAVRVQAGIQEIGNYPKGSPYREAAVQSLVKLPDSTAMPLMDILYREDRQAAEIASEILFRRLYGDRHAIVSHEVHWERDTPYWWGTFRDGETNMLRGSLGIRAPAGVADEKVLQKVIRDAIELLKGRVPQKGGTVDNTIEIAVPEIAEPLRNPEALGRIISGMISYVPAHLDLKRITFTIGLPHHAPMYLTFRKQKDPANPGAYTGLYMEDSLFRWIHSYRAAQIEVWRLRKHFYNDTKKLHTPWEATHLYLAQGRLFAYSVVTHLSDPIVDEEGKVIGYREIDLAFGQAVHAIREAVEGLGKKADSHRVTLVLRAPLTATQEEIERAIKRLAYKAQGLGIQQTTIRFYQIRNAPDQPFEEKVLSVRNPGGSGLLLHWGVPLKKPDGYISPMSDLDQKIRTNARRGVVYPYEYIHQLIQDKGQGKGSFQEFDIENVRVEKKSDGSEKVRYDLKTDLNWPPGENKAKVVFGLVTKKTARHPEGITVMQIVSDPTVKLCPLEEPECARIIAAIDYAEEHGLEIDWKATSSGAGISMTKGTENLDWTARVAKRIGEFCDGGGTVNLIIDGINIGAQSYWDSIATMLLTRKGILIKTPRSATALTGNEAQKISGSVAAEDNIGLAGAERITGPNGETQFFVASIPEATELLWTHHDLTWKRPDEFVLPPWPTNDPYDRDVTRFVYVDPASRRVVKKDDGSEEIQYDKIEVGAILNDKEKKKPFPVRAISEAVRNQDAPVLRRWHLWNRDGADLIDVSETVVGDTPVMMIGIEARSMPRKGDIPPGYSAFWSGSTLFPEGSKKVARALGAASDVMDAVVLANLSGFDGSPESLAQCQLEWGAWIEEMARKFKKKIVFVVVTRYHGGAYVVFSKVLNKNMTAGGIEGTFASVIGGAIAAEVVFPKEVNEEAEKRVKESPTVQAELAAAKTPEEREKILTRVRDEVKAERVRQYDAIHTLERARDVGSIDDIVPPSELRRWIIEKLHEARPKQVQEREGEISLLAESLAQFFSQKGEAGLAMWEGIVMSLGLGPHLPLLRTRAFGPVASGQTELPFSQGSASSSTPPVPLGAGRDEVAPPVDLGKASALGVGCHLIEPGLPLGEVGHQVIAYEEVESTMDVTKELSRAGFPAGTVVLANRQTVGRGRTGRVWDSPPDRNLYLSVLAKPQRSHKHRIQVSFAVAAAVHQTISRITDGAVKIKWPNDVLIDGKKVSGVMVEEGADGDVIGIGLNVNAEAGDFTPEVAALATSLYIATGKKWDREKVVLKQLLENFESWLKKIEKGGWPEVRRYVEQNGYFKDRQVVTVQEGKPIRGLAMGVTGEGALLIQDAEGEIHTIYSGDVKIEETKS